MVVWAHCALTPVQKYSRCSDASFHFSICRYCLPGLLACNILHCAFQINQADVEKKRIGIWWIICTFGRLNKASKSPQWPSSLNSLTRSFFTRQLVDTVTINSAITGCAKARRWRQVLLLLSACMKNLALQPDLLTTTLYLTSCTTAKWHRAVAFLHGFALSSDAFCLDGGVLRLIPDTVFFNGVLRVFERGGLWRQAARLFTRYGRGLLEKPASFLSGQCQSQFPFRFSVDRTPGLRSVDK